MDKRDNSGLSLSCSPSWFNFHQSKYAKASIGYFPKLVQVPITSILGKTLIHDDAIIIIDPVQHIKIMVLLQTYNKTDKHA